MPSGPTVVVTFEVFKPHGVADAAVSDSKYETYLSTFTCPSQWVPEDARYVGSHVEVTFDIERPSHERSVDVRDTTAVVTTHAEFADYRRPRFWEFLIRDESEIVSVGHLGREDWLPSWVTPEEDEATLTMQMTYRHELTKEDLSFGDAEIKKRRRKAREKVDGSSG